MVGGSNIFFNVSGDSESTSPLFASTVSKVALSSNECTLDVVHVVLSLLLLASFPLGLESLFIFMGDFADKVLLDDDVDDIAAVEISNSLWV